MLEGRPTLREPSGTRELAPGEAVRFPLGGVDYWHDEPLPSQRPDS